MEKFDIADADVPYTGRGENAFTTELVIHYPSSVTLRRDRCL
ncbi:hypothetical protein [Geobacter sulfurreducens]|nr:hypothetical protein [Geobacter sulfurreducens]